MLTDVIPGVWGVGVATPLVRVDQVPLGGDTHSWVLTSEGSTVHNAEAITRLKEKLSEGDAVVSEHSPIVYIINMVIEGCVVACQGVSYDHVELNFFLNGKSMQCPVMGIRGMVFPVFYGLLHILIPSNTHTLFLSLLSVQLMMGQYWMFSSQTFHSLLLMDLTESCLKKIYCNHILLMVFRF